MNDFIKPMKSLKESKKGIIGPLQVMFGAVILFVIIGAVMTLLARVNDKLDDGLTGIPLSVADNTTEGLATIASFQGTIGLVIVIVVILLLLVGVISAFKFREA